MNIMLVSVTERTREIGRWLAVGARGRDVGVALISKDVVELCQLSPDQATRLLRALAAKGKLVRRGERKGATYARA